MREKVLIFGANFPVASRIADLVRREFDVMSYDFSAVRESGQVEIATEFTGDLLSSTLMLSSTVTCIGARYVVFTSESLLYIHSKALLSGFLSELQACKRMAGIHLAVWCKWVQTCRNSRIVWRLGSPFGRRGSANACF